MDTSLLQKNVLTEISPWLKLILTEISLWLKMISAEIYLWLKIMLTNKNRQKMLLTEKVTQNWLSFSITFNHKDKYLSLTSLAKESVSLQKQMRLCEHQGLFCHDEVSLGKCLAYFNLWRNLHMLLDIIKPCADKKKLKFRKKLFW